MAHDVFISHSSKDKVMADAICSGLEARGIRCWIAPRDVQPGEEWTRAIVEAITVCKVFLLVFSGNANSSSQIIKEVDCAESDEKTILPFRIEDIKPTGSMKYYLGSLHWLDAITPPMEKQIEHLADYIAHILGFPERGSTEQQNKSETQKTGESASLDRDPSIRNQPEKPKKPKTGLLIALGIIVVGSIIGGLFLTKGNLLAQLVSQPGPTVAVTQATLTLAPNELEATENVSYAIKTQVSPADGMTMVYVLAGEFLMGSPEKIGKDDEHPQHSVYLDSFWIDMTEVTNGMYSKCVGDGICTQPSNNQSDTREEYYDSTQYAEYPVIFVNWDQAVTYCKWAGRRLPTEGEWEKASRGLYGRNYPWGDEEPNSGLANYTHIGGDTSKVGSYINGKSEYGALDMAGNVWEWVSDWYNRDYYNQSLTSNPQGPSSGTYRVIRGGSWAYDMYYVRTANRGWTDPVITNNNNIGFRCAQSE